MEWKFNPTTGQMEMVADANVLGTSLNGDINPSKYLTNTNTVGSIIPPVNGLSYSSVYKDGVLDTVTGDSPLTKTGVNYSGTETQLPNNTTTEPGMFDWLGSDNMKGIGTIGGLAMSGLGIFNTMNAQKEAKRQWEAENARADEIMAMNREKYTQYKADRDRLNTGYGGK